jgi:hypothetical protein
MAVTESRLKTGKLTLGGTPPVTPPGPPTGGTEFACQATNVTITPAFSEDGDTVETLCGDTVLATTKTDWSLTGTSIQDFDIPDSFIKYTWDNNLTEVPFAWQPNENATVFYGVVQVRALTVGGDVNARITADFEWPINGQPDVTWPTVVGADTEADQQEEEPEEEPEPSETDEYAQV